MDDSTPFFCTSCRWVQQYLQVHVITYSVRKISHCLKFFLTLSAFFNLTLKMGTKAYTWSKWPWFQKNLYFLSLVYQIDRFFALIEDPQSKVPRNAYFGHQRAAHFGHQRAKTSNSHFSTNLGPRGLKIFLTHIMSPIKNHACNNWNLWNFAS